MQRTLLVTVVVLAVVVCNYAHKAVFSIQGCVFYLGNLIKWKIDTAKNWSTQILKIMDECEVFFGLRW